MVYKVEKHVVVYIHQKVVYIYKYLLKLIINLAGLEGRTPGLKARDPGSIPGVAIIHFFNNTALRGVARPGGRPDKIKAIRNTVQ